eukprot:2306612-Heterocapsa_arctica.AAC.1
MRTCPKLPRPVRAKLPRPYTPRKPRAAADKALLRRSMAPRRAPRAIMGTHRTPSLRPVVPSLELSPLVPRVATLLTPTRAL